MAKITISRIYEISKALTTKAGQELRDPLSFLSEFAEVTLRNLRNGLTIGDNLDAVSKTVIIRNDTETVISIASSKRPTRIYVDRAQDATYYVVTGFGWKFSNNGSVVVKATFAGNPPSSVEIPLDIVIHFG